MLHDRDFDPAYSVPIELEPGIRRMTARNPGPFTFFGTNTYIIGTGDVVILDPGPMDPPHQDALINATLGQTVTAILVSHTHMDHSPGARDLSQRLDAPVIGCAPHRVSRPLHAGEVNALDASADKAHQPDRELQDGETLTFGSHRLETIATPGHTANHLCFALEGTDILFSADHVMAWATTAIAPPDGSMSCYMASLKLLMARKESRFYPGHGGPVRNAGAYMQALFDHRLAREAAIAACLDQDALTIPEIVERVYDGLDPLLKPAAGLSVFAHLEDLCQQGRITADPALSLSAVYMSAPSA